jgi:hypothetical protein
MSFPRKAHREPARDGGPLYDNAVFTPELVAALIRPSLLSGRGANASGRDRRLSSDTRRWSHHRVGCCAMGSKSDRRLRLGASGRAVHFRRS